MVGYKFNYVSTYNGLINVVDEINGIDKKREFRELIRKLQRAGAETTIYYNGQIIFIRNRQV